MWPQNRLFTPFFCIHTITAARGLRCFARLLRCFHLLTEIYPMVPFPPSVREGVSDYTSTSLRWMPMTSARAAGTRLRAVRGECKEALGERKEVRGERGSGAPPRGEAPIPSEARVG